MLEQETQPQPQQQFPITLKGIIERGYGRGSKLLGFPTANIQITHENEQALVGMSTGVYFGFGVVTPTEKEEGNSSDGCPAELRASLERPHGYTVHKVAVSIGKNPSFKNENKTIEAHIIHKFDNDFYGAYAHVIVLGFLHPMITYTSLDDLIKSITGDVAKAESELDNPAFEQYKARLNVYTHIHHTQ